MEIDADADEALTSPTSIGDVDMDEASTSAPCSSDDVNTASTSAAESTATVAKISTPSPLKTSQSGKVVSYTQQLTDVLTGVSEEIDDPALEDFKIICQRLCMNIDLRTELMSKNSLVQVFHVLMKHTNNDLRQIVLILNEFVPRIIHDLPPKLLERMGWLSETITKENEGFGLADTSVLHGRKARLEELQNLMNFEKRNDIQLINVCGMAGIGKSFLIKHLASRLVSERQTAVIYVDASGITKISDLVAKILENSNISRFASGSKNDLMGSLYEFLKQNKETNFAFILDDLSTLMSESDVKRTNELLTFLNNFIKQTRKDKLKMKMLVTSQTHFKIINEQSEMKELAHVKRMMADYTKDVPLDTLSSEEAAEFLGPSMQSFTNEERSNILKVCGGHPYTLHIMGALANTDFGPTTDMTKASSTDVEALIHNADHMFQRAYDRLTDRQKLILLAVVLFDRDARMSALYYIINPEESSKKFCDQVKKELCNGFWLTFRSCEIRSEGNKKIILNTYHPLIKKFLRKKITSYLADKNCEEYGPFMKLKERYVFHHLSELIEIGKSCVPQKIRNTDFIQIACARFMHGRPNFRISLSFILESENPQLLFSKGPDSNELRDPCDIVHLFLCFHEYHDSFDGFLMEMLSEMIHRTIEDVRHRVLVWSLYAMMLILDQDWRALESLIKRGIEGNDAELIKETSHELYLFCKAIYGYAAGSFYANAPWLKSRTDQIFKHKQTDVLDSAVNNLNKLKDLSPDWTRVCKYFFIHVLLVYAGAVYESDPDDLTAIKQSQFYCEMAQEYTAEVPMLEPRAYIELALFKAIEGNQYYRNDVKRTKNLYTEAQALHIKVEEQFKSRNMSRTAAAARNAGSYAVLLRSWANVLTEHEPIPEEFLKEACIHLEYAIKYSKFAVEIFDGMKSKSKRELIESMYEVLESSERLRTESPQLAVRLRCQRDSFLYAIWIYGMIKNDYRNCHLSASDPTLNALIVALPELMEIHQQPKHEIEKMRATLLKVREEAGKEAEHKLDLSGSESCSSSDTESSVDEWLSKMEQQMISKEAEQMEEMLSAEVTQITTEVNPIQATSAEEQTVSKKRKTSASRDSP